MLVYRVDRTIGSCVLSLSFSLSLSLSLSLSRSLCCDSLGCSHTQSSSKIILHCSAVFKYLKLKLPMNFYEGTLRFVFMELSELMYHDVIH